MFSNDFFFYKKINLLVLIFGYKFCIWLTYTHSMNLFKQQLHFSVFDLLGIKLKVNFFSSPFYKVCGFKRKICHNLTWEIIFLYTNKVNLNAHTIYRYQIDELLNCALLKYYIKMHFILAIQLNYRFSCAQHLTIVNKYK